MLVTPSRAKAVWPQVLKSPLGLAFDVQFGGFMAGQLLHGPGNAFDGLNRLQVGSQDFMPALTSWAAIAHSAPVSST